MVFGFKSHHDEVYGSEGGEHKSKFSHELVAGALTYEATKIFENHQKKEGKPVNHQFAKEAIAGIVGAEADKLFETKGLNHLDKDKVKRDATQQAEQQYQGQ